MATNTADNVSVATKAPVMNFKRDAFIEFSP